MIRSSFLVALVAIVSCKASDAEGKPPQTPVAGEARAAAKAKTTDVTAADYEMPALPHARVTVSDAYGGKHTVDAEVAHTSKQRTRGLMWRTSLGEAEGMIFLFPVEQPVSFWMKNTLISLDLIFINAAKKVVGCIERAEPKSLRNRSVGLPSSYVLEVPAGWCSRRGITQGSAVTIEGTTGLRAEADDEADQ